jgi:MtrB/PioB family decaheme-associated outer membrane protein
VDDSIQAGIEAGRLVLADVAFLATPFDLRSRRDVAALRLTVTPARRLDLTLNVKSTNRTGAQQWGAGWDFTSYVEMPAPIEHRTTDVDTGAEWANDRAMARIGYSGSWFTNRVPTMVFDNPFRLTDTASATSQGRMSRWPNSELQAVNTSGSLKLPARTVATAYISVGRWSDNDTLIPFTINPAIVPIPLPRTTAEAKADVTAMSYTATSRPRNDLWLNVRIRRHDFDNKTPVFPIAAYVREDATTVIPVIGHTEPLSSLRHNADAELSYTRIPLTALRLGYGREAVDRTFRHFETTTEHVWRVSADVSGDPRLTIRTGFERSNRTGTGLDEEVLDEVGEQASLRQFDISDRRRYRVSTVVQYIPIDAVGITGSIVNGNDTRPDAEFGLSFSKQRAYAVSVDAVSQDGITLGLTYGYEDYTTRQRSRQAAPGPQFIDPTRDWSDNGFDRVHTLNASVEMTRLLPGTSLRFSYDLSNARDQYVYEVPSDTTLYSSPSAIPQLPPIRHQIHHGAAELMRQIRRDLTASLVYWYDGYRVTDFALDANTLQRMDMLPNVLLLGSVYRPYGMNTVSFRLRYTWGS